MIALNPSFVADILQRRGYINAEQAATVVQAERSRPRRKSPEDLSTYQLITELQFPNPELPDTSLTDQDIAKAIATDSGHSFVRIDSLELNADLIESRISRPFARKHLMLPLSIVNGKLKVACANPYNLEAIDSFRRIAGGDIEILVAAEPEIQKALTEYYGLRHSVKKAERDLVTGIDLGNLEQLVRLKSEKEIESSDQHIVNAVEFLLQHAYASRASDIHVEPKRDSSVIRFRIDGILHRIQTMPKVVHKAVVSRIKTIARLDIAERRRPQDGRIKTVRGDQEVELRVSSLPVAFGEKIVMRIFDPDVLLQDLAGLGFYEDELDRFEEFIAQPNGIFLVTGPTGSGKTTTLYSTLKEIATDEKNITTIEDPIEMVYERFNQTAVQSKIGISFSSALRHILRQDPDIIMIGEIRDKETATYAVQAALTGHLVLATLHTNDAPSAIARLVDLGIEPYMISSTLIGVMAQRLVRKICDRCKKERYLAPDEAIALKLTVPEGKRIQVQAGEGCHQCRKTGFYGRTGIFELLPIDDGIKELIIEEADTPTIEREAIRRGMTTLRQSGLRKLAEGLTTVEEIIRVTGL